MRIHCPDCGKPVPVEDLDLASQLARCRACNSVFSFRGALDSERRGPHASAVLTPRPRQIRAEQDGDALRIVRPWFRPAYIALAVFSLLWIVADLWMLNFFGSVTASVFGRPAPHGVVRLTPGGGIGPVGVSFGQPRPAFGSPSLLVWIPRLMLLVGLGFGYWALCGVFNHTVIRIGRTVSIRHGPLPWPGSRTLPADQVRQVYVRKRISHYGRGRWHQHGHATHIHSVEPVVAVWFELRAILADGTSLTLISCIDDEEEAFYLEKAIESRLGLANRPVRSEYDSAGAV